VHVLAGQLLALAVAELDRRRQQLLLLLEVHLVFTGLEAQLDRAPGRFRSSATSCRRGEDEEAPVVVGPNTRLDEV
jgi:hypothetical protein